MKISVTIQKRFFEQLLSPNKIPCKVSSLGCTPADFHKMSNIFYENELYFCFLFIVPYFPFVDVNDFLLSLHQNSRKISYNHLLKGKSNIIFYLHCRNDLNIPLNNLLRNVAFTGKWCKILMED